MHTHNVMWMSDRAKAKRCFNTPLRASPPHSASDRESTKVMALFSSLCNQCTDLHTIFTYCVQAALKTKSQKHFFILFTLLLQASKHPITNASSCALVWFPWVFQPPLTWHPSLSSHSSPRTTTIGCHLSTSSRCDCQNAFSLSKRLCVLVNKRAPFRPICLSGWGWDSGPTGGAYSPLIWGLALKWSCETPAVMHGLAGAGLRAEAAEERRWWEFSSCSVLNKYCKRRAAEITVKWLRQWRGCRETNPRDQSR